MSETQRLKPPPGAVAVFTDKLGRVVASVSDFESGGYGGYSLFDAQKMRAQRMLALEVVRGYCSEMILDGLETHDCVQIVQRLVQKGARVTVIPVGHEDAADA